MDFKTNVTTTGGDMLKPVTPQGVCPNCGYCPHCGRGGYGFYPYPYQPWPGYQPYQPTPGLWWYTTTNGTGNINGL